MRVVAPSREWLTERTELLLFPHAVDPHQVRGLPICLAGKFGTRELRSPAAFCFQGLGDFPRIADEMVPRERKLEAKPPLLWVHSAAQHEPSEEAPVSPTIAGQYALPPDRLEHHP